MRDSSRRICVVLCWAALSLLALAPQPVEAATDGAYRITPQTLGVVIRVSFGAGGRSATVRLDRQAKLASGQLPPAFFADEKAKWQRTIDSWRLPPARCEEALRHVNGAYDDLEAGINRFLRGFPEEMTVRQAGSLGATLRLEDRDFGRSSGARAFYDPRKGTFRAPFLLVDPATFGNSRLVFSIGSWEIHGSLPARDAGWSVAAILVGGARDAGPALSIDFRLNGKLALEPTSRR